jgi:hypothetical protein
MRQRTLQKPRERGLPGVYFYGKKGGCKKLCTVVCEADTSPVPAARRIVTRPACDATRSPAEQSPPETASKASGSLAMLAAIRRASSLVSGLAPVRLSSA